MDWDGTLAIYAPRRRACAWVAPHAVAMVAVAAKKQKGGIPVVRTGVKKYPAIQPGGSARAIDTFQAHFITDGEFAQAFESAKNFLRRQCGAEGREGYLEGYTTMIAYLAGYAGNMPLSVAVDGTREILHERYGLEDYE